MNEKEITKIQRIKLLTKGDTENNIIKKRNGTQINQEKKKIKEFYHRKLTIYKIKVKVS